MDSQKEKEKETTNLSEVKPLDQEKKMSPTELKMLKMWNRLRTFLERGARKAPVSKHAHMSMTTSKIKLHKRSKREMQQASRKANRGTKGRTSLHKRK